MNVSILNSKAPLSHYAGARLFPWRARCVVVVAAHFLALNLPAQTDPSNPAETSVRRKFVPSPATNGSGATFSSLRQEELDDPGVLTFIAHAGVGDSFPVQEEGKPKDFDVKIKSGDDDKLVLEFSQDGKPAFAPITLGRDWTPAQSGDVRTPQFQYEFKYPSVAVSGKAKTVTDKAMIIVRRIPLNYAFSTTTEKGTRLYTVRFDGTEIQTLRDALRYAFPGDNVVLSPSAEQQTLPGFEVRNVRLSELARTIEFLSEGRLTVEMVEKDADMPGNIWRISGTRSPSMAKGVKMRAVATPHLFADEKIAAKIELDVLRELEHLRLDTAVSASVAATGVFTRGNSTSVQRLTSQKVFVLVGSEEGVDGLESFLKAAELRAAEEAAAKKALAAAAVPKMRAVAAPHVFQNASRLDKVKKAAEEMISLRATLARAVAQSYGATEDLGIGAHLESRPDQKLFVLFGPEDMLDGMESFILAAEKLAVDEDALAEIHRDKDKP